MQLYEKYKTQFLKYEVDKPKRLAMFMAEAEHESKLLPQQENLNYSAEGLMKTFSKYFNDKALAIRYARKPRMIANLVYGWRMGNEKNGLNDDDGWLFSGKGLFQLTGASNYELCSAETGLDCVNHPEILLTEAGAIISALWFWKHNNLNRFADKSDIVGCTKVINGGLIGIKERSILYTKWCKILGC